MNINRKNILVYFGGAIIIFFILPAIFSEPSTTPTVVSEREQIVSEQEEKIQEVEEETVVQEEELEKSESITETPSVENVKPQPQPQQPEPKPEPQQSEPELEPISDGKKWYVSSHHSSQYYYCEEGPWKGLSERYLRVYDSEVALLADYPNHTLHESCQ